MSDKQKIKAEVERLKEENSIGLSEYEAGFCNGVGETCEQLLSFINSLPKEPVSEDLEEAAQEYAKSKHTDKELQKIVAWDFEAGANWKERQMMKNAIDGYVSFNRDAQREGLDDCLVVTNEKPESYFNERGLQLGDKVKVVIIKEK